MQEIPSKLQVLVYPNPSDGTFRVRVPEATTLNLELMDLAGRVVWRDEAFVNGSEVHSGGLAEGVYFLRVGVGNAQAVRKVVIR